MALCPECFEEKELLAPRCHNCNTEIPLGWQFKSNAIYYGVQIFGFIFIVWLIIG
jgi:hypothetical protein